MQKKPVLKIDTDRFNKPFGTVFMTVVRITGILGSDISKVNNRKDLLRMQFCIY